MGRVQCGCEQRIKVIVKMQKKVGGGGPGPVGGLVWCWVRGGGMVGGRGLVGSKIGGMGWCGVWGM